MTKYYDNECLQLFPFAISGIYYNVSKRRHLHTIKDTAVFKTFLSINVYIHQVPPPDQYAPPNLD
jgi:hypothetical protein